MELCKINVFIDKKIKKVSLDNMIITNCFLNVDVLWLINVQNRPMRGRSHDDVRIELLTETL